MIPLKLVFHPCVAHQRPLHFPIINWQHISFAKVTLGPDLHVYQLTLSVLRHQREGGDWHSHPQKQCSEAAHLSSLWGSHWQSESLPPAVHDQSIMCSQPFYKKRTIKNEWMKKYLALLLQLWVENGCKPVACVFSRAWPLCICMDFICITSCCCRPCWTTWKGTPTASSRTSWWRSSPRLQRMTAMKWCGQWRWVHSTIQWHFLCKQMVIEHWKFVFVLKKSVLLLWSGREPGQKKASWLRSSPPEPTSRSELWMRSTCKVKSLGGSYHTEKWNRLRLSAEWLWNCGKYWNWLSSLSPVSRAREEVELWPEEGSFWRLFQCVAPPGWGWSFQ